jgi:hypothetical protein
MEKSNAIQLCRNTMSVLIVEMSICDVTVTLFSLHKDLGQKPHIAVAITFTSRLNRMLSDGGSSATAGNAEKAHPYMYLGRTFVPPDPTHSD